MTLDPCYNADWRVTMHQINQMKIIILIRLDTTKLILDLRGKPIKPIVKELRFSADLGPPSVCPSDFKLFFFLTKYNYFLKKIRLDSSESSPFYATFLA
jgi:hypothetical protein